MKLEITLWIATSQKRLSKWEMRICNGVSNQFSSGKYKLKPKYALPGVSQLIGLSSCTPKGDGFDQCFYLT